MFVDLTDQGQIQKYRYQGCSRAIEVSVFVRLKGKPSIPVRLGLVLPHSNALVTCI